MKKIFLIAGVAAFLFSACRKDEIVPKPNPPEPEPPVVEEHFLVSVIDSMFIAPENLSTAISESPLVGYYSSAIPTMGTPMKAMLRAVGATRLPRLDSVFDAQVGRSSDGQRQWQFCSYSFSYKSTSASGQPIVLSGRVTFPNNTVGQTHRLTSYSLFGHPLYAWYGWAPSASLSMLDLKAYYNSAVISPDFQGLGIDYDVNSSAFFSTEVLSRQLADCALAAIELMRSHGVVLDEQGYSTFWACSECASSAVELQRYYETTASDDFRAKFRFHSAFAVEGPLTLSQAVRYAVDHPEYNSLAYILVPQMVSFSPEQMGGFDGTDFMPDWMSVRYPTSTGENSFIESITRLKGDVSAYYPEGFNVTDIHNILAPDMFGNDGLYDMANPKTQIFLNTVDNLTSVDDFHPAAPLYLAHCPQDEYILYDHMRDVYTNMKHGNPSIVGNVHFLDVPTVESAAQMLGSNHTFAAIMSLFYMACAEKPVDMTRFYTLNDCR